MKNKNSQSEEVIYTEQMSSNRTTMLFLLLTVVFLLLFIWRIYTRGQDAFSAVLLCFSLLFVFYTLNFRTLDIRISRSYLRLKFGLFTWSEALENIQDSSPDEIPALMRFGGAGIHFMFIRKRYRVSFNFLEYPRLVILLKKPRGPVQDVSFSTRHPHEILDIISTLLHKKSLPLD